MADAPEKPVVFIIHGAWHGPAHMEPLMAKLREQGFEAVCAQNPTSDNPPGVKPLKENGVLDDAAFAVKNISALLDQNRLVFVVCHSYGGMVCTEAIDEELSAIKRAQRGLRGGVVGLFYMAAFLLSKGENGATWMYLRPDTPDSLPQMNTDWGLAYAPKGSDTFFYNDLEPKEQQHWISLLRGQSLGAFKSTQSKTAYIHYSTTYLFCDNDNAITPIIQRAMVDSVNKQTTIREARCTASHSPFLSQPEKVVEEIVAAIQWSQPIAGERKKAA